MRVNTHQNVYDWAFELVSRMPSTILGEDRIGYLRRSYPGVSTHTIEEAWCAANRLSEEIWKYRPRMENTFPAPSSLMQTRTAEQVAEIERRIALEQQAIIQELRNELPSFSEATYAKAVEAITLSHSRSFGEFKWDDPNFQERLRETSSIDRQQ